MFSDEIPSDIFPALKRAALTFPAIDNHAHPLLRKEHRHDIPFEGVISEANGEALSQDAPHTLACMRAVPCLAKLLGLPHTATWEEVKSKRAEYDYEELCKLSFRDMAIESILIDDGLGNRNVVNEVSWHDQFTGNKCWRIVRVEMVAEDILKQLLEPHLATDSLNVAPILGDFTSLIRTTLIEHAQDPHVAGFKSIVCYRTGLDVSMYSSQAGLKFSLLDVFKMLQTEGKIRLAHKDLNDLVVRTTLEVAGAFNKPVQFHTGLGDNDISLVVSSPSRLQPVIRNYPHTTFVLLHSSYPYTREAGYLTAVYSNVYLDFGEVFPFVSAQGQKSVLRQVLELAPTNKILWSTDGHFWPESYHLAVIQSRQALYAVLREIVESGDLSEAQAVTIIENALFHTANRVYALGLKP